MALKVLVAGGGIGGLAAALACAQAGAEVALFEQAAQFVEVGAGIQLGPNVVQVLQTFGLHDALANRVARPDRLQVCQAASGRLLATLRLGADAVARYGQPYWTVHRADLHHALLAALNAQANVSLTLNAALTSFEQDSLRVRLHLGDSDAANDSVCSGDLLVGADGVWSRVRQQLLGDGPPSPTGHLAYRALVRQSDLPARLRSQNVTVWLGPNLHVVQYPVRGGDWLNLVGIVVGESVDAVQGGAGRADSAVAKGVQAHQNPANASNAWDQASPAVALRAALAGMCAPLQELAGYIDHWRVWPLSIRAPMRGPAAMASGRVALLGDAAHPMLPYLAQGAGMALEDAAQLGLCLSGLQGAGGVSDAADLPQRLRQYAANRWQRNARVQAKAIRNGHIFHATGVVAMARDAALKLLGQRLLDTPWLYQPKAGAASIVGQHR